MIQPWTATIGCGPAGSFDSGVTGLVVVPGSLGPDFPAWARALVGVVVGAKVMTLKITFVGTNNWLFYNFPASEGVYYPVLIPLHTPVRLRFSAPASSLAQGTAIQISVFLSSLEVA